MLSTLRATFTLLASLLRDITEMFASMVLPRTGSVNLLLVSFKNPDGTIRLALVVLRVMLFVTVSPSLFLPWKVRVMRSL